MTSVSSVASSALPTTASSVALAAASTAPTTATLVPLESAVNTSINTSQAPISFTVVIEGALLLAVMAAWNNAIQNSIKYFYPYKQGSASGEIIFASIVTITCLAIVAAVQYASYLETEYQSQVTNAVTSITEIVPKGQTAVSTSADMSQAQVVNVIPATSAATAT